MTKTRHELEMLLQAARNSITLRSSHTQLLEGLAEWVFKADQTNGSLIDRCEERIVLVESAFTTYQAKTNRIIRDLQGRTTPQDVLEDRELARQADVKGNRAELKRLRALVTELERKMRVVGASVCWETHPLDESIQCQLTAPHDEAHLGTDGEGSTYTWRSET